MLEPFTLQVPYKNKVYDVNMQLQHWGYEPRFEVVLSSCILYLQRDEEGSFRALLHPDSAQPAGPDADPQFIATIIATLEEALL